MAQICYKGDHLITYDMDEAEATATLWGVEATCSRNRDLNGHWEWFCIVPIPEEHQESVQKAWGWA